MASGSPHPDAPKLAATAGKASRFNTYASGPLLFAMLAAPHFSLMSGPVLLVVTVVGVGFWFGMIKRSFKVKHRPFKERFRRRPPRVPAASRGLRNSPTAICAGA